MNLVIYFSVFFSCFLLSFVLFCFSLDVCHSRLLGQHPDHVKPNTKDLLTLLMKSKADSTFKRYTKEIVKFSRLCNLSSIQPLLVTAPVYRNVYLNYTVAGSRTVLKTCMSLKMYLSVKQ